ncbi:MAG TPA: hypothetical protein VLF94_04615 [Chlamydiales bacterium]|nr:hypothetical protein [Chlamydiales bacterium]
MAAPVGPPLFQSPPPTQPASSKAKEFFNLILDRKYQGHEYEAWLFIANTPTLIQELSQPCANPTFKGQIVAEQFLEQLLKHPQNLHRFEMVRTVANIMRVRNIGTNFSDFAQGIALLQIEEKRADDYIRKHLQDIETYLGTFIDIYRDEPELLARFKNLRTNTNRVLHWIGLEEED